MTQARLVGPDGEEVESLDKPGEVLISSPNLFTGYLGNEEATKDAFDERGWLRTGDIGMFKKSPNGAEHLFILDRIKEMIKVKVGGLRRYLPCGACSADANAIPGSSSRSC